MATTIPLGRSSTTATLSSTPGWLLLRRTVTVERPPDCTRAGANDLAPLSADSKFSVAFTGPGLAMLRTRPLAVVSLPWAAPAGRLFW